MNRKRVVDKIRCKDLGVTRGIIGNTVINNKLIANITEPIKATTIIAGIVKELTTYMLKNTNTLIKLKLTTEQKGLLLLCVRLLNLTRGRNLQSVK